MLDFIRNAAERWGIAPAFAPAVMLVLKAAVLLLVTAMVARALKQMSAAKRHLIWRAGIASAVLLPLAAVSLPSWRVPIRYEAVAVVAPLAPTTTETMAMGELREAASALAARFESVLPTAAQPSATAPASRDVRGSSGALVVSLTNPAAALTIWLLGAVVVMCPWMVGVITRRQLARTATDLLPAPWERSVRALRLEGNVPPRVRVWATADSAMPMTWGIARPIVLVPARTQWQDNERRNALLHEFAHVRRGDCVTQVLSRVMCAMYWFNPIAWMVARAERLAREEACDDAVLRAGSRASAYAEQLLVVARTAARSSVAVAALTMARRSNIARRLRAILDAARDRSASGRRLSYSAMCAAGTLVSLLAALSPELVRADVMADARSSAAALRTPAAIDSGPSSAIGARSLERVNPMPVSDVDTTTRDAALGQQAMVCAPTSGKRSSSNMHYDDGRSPNSRRWQVRWSDGTCRLELDARGVFTLSPNADDVVTISRGGYFELQQDSGGIERRVRIEPADGGGLERTYWIDGKRTPWSAEAATWFAQALVMLDRRTAFAVDTRLPMLLQRGGVDAVMTEVAQMPSTYAQRVYYTKLFELQQLSAAQLIRVLETATRGFDSGYEKAELLLRVAKQPSFGEPVHLAFAQMARSIESDYEKRRALGALLVRTDLKPEVVRTMLEASEDMKSDYELAELLTAIDRRYAVDESTRPFYVRALSTINSDYEQRRVLATIMRGGGLTAAATGELVTVAGRTMKGYELAEFLVGISDKGTLDQATSSAFFTATKNVESDYERRRVLEALLRKGQLTRQVVEGILATAATIDGDYECAELLVAVARAFTIDDALRPAFEKAAATIGGDYEYGRAMSAVRRSAQRTGS